MDRDLGRKIFSTLLMIIMSGAVMVVLWRFAPVQATTAEMSSVSSEVSITLAPEESATPAQSEAPEETTTPEETGSPAPAGSSAPAPATPAPTKAPTKAPTTPTMKPTPVVPTTPPKLELLTPPGVTAPATTTPAEEILPPEASGFEEEILPDATLVPTPTHRVEHIEQVEIDAGFQFSDFIEILCWIAYTLAGTFLLFGLARIAILMLLKRDILPSKKEREKAKADKLRKEAEKDHKVIQTDISQEDFQIHKDDWNWK